VEGVTFDLSQTVGVLGESGSGKTSIALAIAGLLNPNARIESGSILFCGTDLLRAPARRRSELQRRIGFIYQDPSAVLNPFLTVGDQVAEVARLFLRGRRAIRDAAEETMCQAGLPDAARLYDRYPHELSGGQKQRIVFAQALIGRPALLVADEPTSSLDTVVQCSLLQLLRRLQTSLGLSLLFITHDPTVLSPLNGRVIVLQEGRIVESGELAEVATRPRHPYTRSLIESIPGTGRAPVCYGV
jgi:ABC-type dipeptide/oligopeptide/nickel transport system ATPase component